MSTVLTIKPFLPDSLEIRAVDDFGETRFAIYEKGFKGESPHSHSIPCQKASHEEVAEVL